MFLAEDLVFLELQKTGGSHIGRLLEQHVGGQTAGKHHRLTDQELSGRYVIGSIRNPWDWYVSLWAYGCGGKGSIRMRTARRIDLKYYFRGLPETMGREKLNTRQIITSAYHDVVKPVSRWQQTYRDPSDPVGFQNWLAMLLNKKHHYDIGEGFGFSPLSEHSGLLSYRYFRLFTQGAGVFHDRRLRYKAGIKDFDKEQNITDGVIRMESLGDDFISILGKANVTLTESQRNAIRSKNKTNASTRQGAAHYYNDEAIALVAEKESYLIEKYGYTPPV